jgi:hypothetical protein
VLLSVLQDRPVVTVGASFVLAPLLLLCSSWQRLQGKWLS